MTGGSENTSDEVLAVRAAGDDRAAFDCLVRRYKEPLYRFVRRYVGDADDAYDVLQDGFISAWTSLSRFDPKRPFAPWLHTIMLNKCRDFGRRQTVRRAFLRLVALDAGESIVPHPGAGEADEGIAARLHRLDKAVSNLTSYYKEPLLLTVVEGMSQEEVAKVLKTTRKAIEMRLYRARRKLAVELEQTREG